MGLRPRDGNMYDFITHSWNTIGGKCFHGCTYCFRKQEELKREPYLHKDIFKTDLGHGNFIFVGSGIDLFADDIPKEWILETLNHCYNANNTLFEEKKNKYMFQSKNPRRILEFKNHPVFQYSVICTTIETNKWIPEVMNNSPEIEDRVSAMDEIASMGFKTYVTVEPIMEFDLKEMVECIRRCNPEQVNFGKNSRKDIEIHEPNNEQFIELLTEVAKFTPNNKVVVKHNAIFNSKKDQTMYYDHELGELVEI